MFDYGILLLQLPVGAWLGGHVLSAGLKFWAGLGEGMSGDYTLCRLGKRGGDVERWNKGWHVSTCQQLQRKRFEMFAL